jgi:hypothetical protein
MKDFIPLAMKTFCLFYFSNMNNYYDLNRRGRDYNLNLKLCANMSRSTTLNNPLRISQESLDLDDIISDLNSEVRGGAQNSEVINEPKMKQA